MLVNLEMWLLTLPVSVYNNWDLNFWFYLHSCVYWIMLKDWHWKHFSGYFYNARKKPLNGLGVFECTESFCNISFREWVRWSPAGQGFWHPNLAIICSYPESDGPHVVNLMALPTPDWSKYIKVWEYKAWFLLISSLSPKFLERNPGKNTVPCSGPDWNQNPSPENILKQGCKFSGNYLNSGFHEVQISALLFIFSPFWTLLAWFTHSFKLFLSGLLTSLFKVA